jgi:hypothetical protein
MKPLEPLGISEPRPVTRWLPQFGGLLVAGVVAFLVCRPPLLHTLSWSEIIIASVGSVLAVFAATAVTVWGLYRLLETAINTRRLVLRTSLDALWLAPVTFFIRENSAWTIAMAAVLVVAVTKSFGPVQDCSDRGQAENPPDLFSNSNLFSPTESSPWFWRQLCAAVAALCAQTGALAGFAGYPLPAAALVGISSAVWTSSFTMDAVSDTPQSSGKSQPTSRMLLAVAMVIVSMVGGLIRYLPNTLWFGGFGHPSTHHSHHLVTHLGQRGEPGSEKRSEGEARLRRSTGEKASEGLDETVSEANSGIILWPKEQAYTRLVAPAPATGSGLLTSNPIAKPLVVPFSGVYWFYKAPDLHPPRSSRQAHGSPELLDIHSTDRRPLSMEAHENFGSMIDVDCCSRIQISIRNADLYSETVSLELILINSSLPGKPSQSLGTVMSKSTRAWKIYEKPSPTAETLNFPIPANLSLRRFDEVMIVFRLAPFRADDGAKIAIDHFVLVPRGL